MSRTLLTLLPVFPFDPGGGAQRSMDGISRLLATRGWRCTTLATTLSDSSAAIDFGAMLKARGIAAHVDRSERGSVWRFRDGGVDYTLLEVPQERRAAWPKQDDAQFDRLLEATLKFAAPNVVHTFGATPVEQARQARCRRHGAAVVLSVRVHGYYDRRAFEHADAVVTPSRFLSDRYREKIGIESTPLPVPMDWEAVKSPTREPIFVTYVNPSPEKGVLFFARLADELATARPDIPMMVFESRGTAGTLVSAGNLGGLELRRHESIMVSPGVALPRDVFAAARVLLMPSVWEEPAGRVIVEAMINGVPSIVSDRGGMSELLGDSGFVLPLPKDLGVESRSLPSPEGVRPWIDLIVRLCDDEPFYAAQCDRSLAAAGAWRPESLAATYDDYFRNVRKRA